MQPESDMARSGLWTAVSIILSLLPLTRLLVSHNDVTTDITTFLCIFAARNSFSIHNLLHLVTAGTYRNAFIACATLAFAHKLLPRLKAGLILPKDQQSKRSSNEKTTLQPLLLPCRTNHTRFSPYKHSFSYSYLFAGIPIGWIGQAGNLLSSGCTGAETIGNGRKSTWFKVENQDYLRRGSHPDGLLGKLREYLETQSVDASRYPFAYLVTAPRFGGVSFNPVSFWYLYSGKKSLDAMILEVNNTFDERRMYYLEVDHVEGYDSNEMKLFKQTWPKDFHVSPFNDRDGSYSVTCSDPFAPSFGGTGKVDVNIVLNSPDGKPKLVARVFSEGSPIDPHTTSTFGALMFVMRWWWVGFMTNPRILREARQLWAKGLQVFYRPEVLLGSIGRQQTTEEAIIEGEFSRLLEDSAKSLQCSIFYTAAAGSQCGLKQRLGVESSTRILQINVLTPSFYSALAQSNNTICVIKQLAFTGLEKERMLYISDDKLCEEIFSAHSPQNLSQTRSSSKPIRALFRLAKSHIASKSSLPDTFMDNTIQQPTPYSELDQFVLDTSPNAANYMIASSTIIASNTLALGYSALLSLYRKIILFAACYHGASTISISKDPSGQWETVWNSSSRLLPVILVMVSRRFMTYAHTDNKC